MIRIVLWSILTVLFFAYPAFPQDPAWEQNIDFAAKTDMIRDVVTTGQLMIVAGNAAITNGTPDCVIRAFDKMTGTVIWNHQELTAEAAATCRIAVNGDRLYAAIEKQGVQPGVVRDLAIKAFVASTGQFLWENILDTGRDDVASAIRATNQYVAVVGYGANLTNQDPVRGIVRVLTVNGEVLLTDIMPTQLWSVAINGTVVTVGGSGITTINPPSRTYDWFIRTYNIGRYVSRKKAGTPENVR